VDEQGEGIVEAEQQELPQRDRLRSEVFAETEQAFVDNVFGRQPDDDRAQQRAAKHNDCIFCRLPEDDAHAGKGKPTGVMWKGG
jgi:hypothetical protein